MVSPVGRAPAGGRSASGGRAGAPDIGSAPMRQAQADLLGELRALEFRIERLGALLERQRRQVEDWNVRLYGAAPAGAAARRLMALKHARG